MIVQVHDLLVGLAVQAGSAADALLGGLSALYAAGASNGVDPGPLAVGTGTALAAGGAAAASGGSAEDGGAGSGDDEGVGPDTDTNDDDCT